jgi:hypothetical protein
MEDTFRVDIVSPPDRKIEIGEEFHLLDRPAEGYSDPIWLDLKVESIERVHPGRHETKTITTCKLVLNLVAQR